MMSGIICKLSNQFLSLVCVVSEQLFALRLCVGLVREPLSDEKWFCPKCQKKINKQAKQQAKYRSHAI
jgi:hypothetical protein